MVLREMCGGVMFAEPRGIESISSTEKRGYDTTSYSTFEIERLARVASCSQEDATNVSFRLTKQTLWNLEFCGAK